MLEELLLARVVLELWVVDLAYCLGRVSLIPVEMPHQISCVDNFVKTQIISLYEYASSLVLLLRITLLMVAIVGAAWLCFLPRFL